MQSGEYRTVASAFRTLQFSGDAVDSIWRLVAVILHLGNLRFSKDDDSENAGKSTTAIVAGDREINYFSLL